ncbi:MAG: glutathione S-transferase [Halobacteriovorax sp.]|nr:glutathione S-transferase [Halobacteriovorax sp.]|tara:strand:+ start:2115 stop:2786 length:672 start_codon:yes stop_codon:yes gene_type:complete
MITLHHLENSRSHRILWLLEELELKYEVIEYKRNKLTMLAPKELKDIHPLGKSPVITDQGKTIAESGAIIEYLVEEYDKKERFKPQSRDGALEYRYWLHYAEGSLMMPLMMTLLFAKIEASPMPFIVKPIVKGLSKTVRASFITPQRNLHLNFLNEHLGKNKWFCGNEFSAADIQLSFPIESASHFKGFTKDFPALISFLKQIKERPAYQKAQAVGGELKSFI